MLCGYTGIDKYIWVAILHGVSFGCEWNYFASNTRGFGNIPRKAMYENWICNGGDTKLCIIVYVILDSVLWACLPILKKCSTECYQSSSQLVFKIEQKKVWRQEAINKKCGKICNVNKGNKRFICSTQLFFH